jgi:excisionase family DNA binding protein
MTPDPDYTTWLTKQQAADAIGVSTKTIEQLTKDKKLEQARWRRPDGGPELAVYHPDDVARIAQERRPARPPFVLPAGVPGNGQAAANGNGHADHPALSQALAVPPATPAGYDAVRLFMETMVTAVMSQSSQTSQNSQKSPGLFLTLAEAATFSGLPQTDLRRLIAAGELPVRKTGRGGIRIRRRDLELL